MNGFTVIPEVAMAVVLMVVAVALRVVAGVLRFVGTYPRLTAAMVGLWWLAEVAQ